MTQMNTNLSIDLTFECSWLWEGMNATIHIPDVDANKTIL